MEQLQRALEQAKAGQGQIVGTMGEPGLGKSRLFHEFVGAMPGFVGATGRSPRPTDLHIPPTVQGILAARIDRLAPDEKALLQQLSVIGREFPLSLVRQVISQPEADLYRLLASLQRKEFLYEQPAFPESEYIFKHALTQEVAYGTVLHERRKALHEQTARVIEELYQATLEDHYSELAHHYSRTENARQAVKYLGLAAQQAVQRSAHAEAMTLLTEAVMLVQRLPTTPEHLQQELTLQTALGSILITTRGYGALATESAYTRAYALCQQLGETAQLFLVLWGLQQMYMARANYQKGQEYGEQMLSLAQRSQDPSLLVWANRVLGEVACCVGELSAAKTYCEDSIALSDLQQRRTQPLAYGEDSAISGRFWRGTSLFLMGYPDRALQVFREALTLASELTHANGLVAASIGLAWLHTSRREPHKARSHAETALVFATEHGMPFWLGWGTIIRGWTLSVQGEGEAGIAEIRRGLVIYQATGATELLTFWLALLAEAYLKNWQTEEGLATVSEALAFADRTDERFYEAELYRLKGELLLQKAREQAPENGE